MDAELGRPWLDSETRSPDPAICPFLRAVDEGRLLEPINRPGKINRCLATGRPAIQTSRWQATHCLVADHVTCPRYLRGAGAPSEPEDAAGLAGPGLAAAGIAAAPAPAATSDGQPAEAAEPGSRPASPRSSRSLTPAIVLAAVFLVASAAAAIAFVAATGGLALPSSLPTNAVAGGPTPSGAVTATPGATATPAATATATATPVPTPAATPAVTPGAGPTPAPTSNRYALLVPCPSTPSCYEYTIRSGDNLRSIANYFGVPYDTILQMNPQITDPATIQPGDVIKLPPPTR